MRGIFDGLDLLCIVLAVVFLALWVSARIELADTRARLRSLSKRYADAISQIARYEVTK